VRREDLRAVNDAPEIDRENAGRSIQNIVATASIRWLSFSGIMLAGITFTNLVS
jgi:hypothetical protein